MPQKKNPINNDIFSANPPGVSEKLSKLNAFIAGAGGLGSNVAFMLTRAGIGKLTIADFDTIEPSNLNRQQYFRQQIGMKKVLALKENLLQINPEIGVAELYVRLTPENFDSLIPHDTDIIFECFDSAESKADIVRFCLKNRSTIPLIAVSGLAGSAPCDTIRVKRVQDNFYMVGDFTSDVDKQLGTLSSRVSFAAAMQAHLGIEILSGQAGSASRE